MRFATLLVLIAAFLLVVSLAATARAQAQTEFPVDPRRTFFRTYNDSPVYDSIPLELAAMDIFAGDWLRLRTLGDFDLGAAFDDTYTRMHAVFSSSSTLLGQDQQYRVPGAIDAGVDVVSASTYHGSRPTDFPEDFEVTDVVVQVPAGALYLFVCGRDTLYHDNSDPDGDFRIGITKLRLVGLSNRDARSPLVIALGDRFAYKTWGRVPAVTAETFTLDDGSGFPVTVSAPGHSVTPADYAWAVGRIDNTSTPATLLSAPQQIGKAR